MKIKFIPQNVEVDLDPNKSIMRIAQENNLFIKSVCNGLPSCAECRVQIEEGEHNVLPPTSEELSLIGTGHFVDRRRLSCQLKCFGPMVIDLAEQVEKEKLGGNKRPQGHLRKDSTEQSLAVTGNLIDADVELLSAEDLNINEDSIEDDKPQSALSGVKKSKSRNRNRNNKKRPPKKVHASANKESSDGKPANKSRPKNKNRNRNRNRNRKNNKPKPE